MSWLRGKARVLAWAVALALVALVVALVSIGYDVIDVLLGLEVALLVFVGLPLSIRGTARLVQAVLESTANDRLARAITAYVSLVTFTALYIGALQLWRVVTESAPIEVLRPVTGALVIAVLCGPAFVVHVIETGPNGEG